MNLSDRLIKIAGFIKNDTIVLDVGTDHGYIPIYLIENKISKNIIASDISFDSLNKTVELVKKKGLEKNIDSRLGDGLDVVKPFEVEGVIMAGMGGILIQNIMEKNKEVTDSIGYFIFQPMIASKELRQYLSRNNFKIIDEELSKEGDKFYEILYVEKGCENPKKEIYYEISEKLVEKKHPLLKEFIGNKIKLINSVMENLKDKTSKRSVERYKELEEKINEYMEVLNSIEA